MAILSPPALASNLHILEQSPISRDWIRGEAAFKWYAVLISSKFVVNPSVFMLVPSPEPDSATSVNDSTREAEFLRQLAVNYRGLYASAMAIMGNRNDADDVIQEVCVVLWQKYDEFQPGTNFRKWAWTVAFNVARAHLRKRRRHRGAALGDEALGRIVRMRSAASELLELRRELLRECLSKMTPTNRHFLFECYRTSTSQVEYAQTKGQTVSAVYSRLKRLRKALVDCVQRRLEGGEE